MAEASGLQAERTGLAWSRTLLAVAATAVILARTADPGVERPVAVVLTVVGVALVTVAAVRRQRMMRTPPQVAMTPSLGGLVFAGLAALQVAALVVIL